jgi:hypothetical protein
MSLPGKRKRHCTKASLEKQAKAKRLYRRCKRWIHQGEVMYALSANLKNETGNSRTFEENKLLIYAIEASLNRTIESIKNKSVCPTEVS